MSLYTPTPTASVAQSNPFFESLLMKQPTVDFYDEAGQPVYQYFDEAGNYTGPNPGNVEHTDLKGPDGKYPQSGPPKTWPQILNDMANHTTKSALLVSGLAQMKGGMDAAKTQRKVGEINAATLAREADYQLERGHLATLSSRRKYQALLSKQAAGYGASGVSMSEGTPLMVMQDTLRAQEEDADLIKYGADISSAKVLNQIPGTRLEAQLAARKSVAAGTDSLLTAAGRWWQLNG